MPGYTGKLRTSIGFGVDVVFPKTWPRVGKNISIFINSKDYTTIGFNDVWIIPSLPLGSANWPFVPGMSIDEEAFHGQTERAIAELLHEMMHDFGSDQGYGTGLGHGTIDLIMSDFEEFVVFLKMTKCNGTSLWDLILQQAGPRPTGGWR